MTVSVVLCCGVEPPSEQGWRRTEISDSSGVVIVDNWQGSWTTSEAWRVGTTPLLEIGVEDGDPNYTFGRIRDARMLESNQLVVADSRLRVLRLYDTGGRFIKETGGEGRGPGEFLSMVSLGELGPDTIYVYDLGVRRVSYFDTRLNFEGSVNLNLPEDLSMGVVVAVFADGTFLVESKALPSADSNGSLGELRLPDELFRYDHVRGATTFLRTTPGSESLRFRSGGTISYGSPVFWTSTIEFTMASGFAVASNDTYEFRFYDGANELQRIVRREHATRETSQRDIDEFTELLVGHDSEDPWSRAFRAALRDIPAPTHMPAFGRLAPISYPWVLGDPSGNLWVVDYGFPIDHPETWSVFDDVGVFLGTVEMPFGFVLLDIGESRVIGVWRDSLDVNYLRMYELLK